MYLYHEEQRIELKILVGYELERRYHATLRGQTDAMPERIKRPFNDVLIHEEL
jgi:hypothetical protein